MNRIKARQWIADQDANLWQQSAEYFAWYQKTRPVALHFAEGGKIEAKPEQYRAWCVYDNPAFCFPDKYRVAQTPKKPHIGMAAYPSNPPVIAPLVMSIELTPEVIADLRAADRPLTLEALREAGVGNSDG